MNAREIIEKTLKEITGLESVQIGFADRAEHGDYTTNVAMQSGKNPREVSHEIVEKLNKNVDLKKLVSKIEIAGPGFINFFLSDEVITDEIGRVLSQKEEYGKSNHKRGQKVIVEFTDPNPFKELHIGHLYSNIVGESISKLLESQGAMVKRACYQGDVGLHVAKSLWGMKKKLENETLESLERKSVPEKVRFLGQAYALGATAYEDDLEAKDEIIELNKQVFEKSNQVQELYIKGRKWSLEYFDQMYARIGTTFDYFFFESDVSDDGVLIVKKFLAEGVFEESNGAIIFPGEKYGLHTRVFINSLGLPTYEAKELALAPRKYEVFPYDQSIVVTANEINEYFKVLLKALSLTRPDLAEKTVHIGHGFVRLPGGKMSSRTGKVITAEKVLELSKSHALTIQDDKGNIETAEMIGQAAIKYGFLKNNIGGDIEFDLEKSVSFTGNSGPYLQYTVVRINSLVTKSGVDTDKLSAHINVENEIVRNIIKFPEVLGNAAQKYQPSYLAEYLYRLASEFNTFYDTNKVLGSEKEKQYLALSMAVGIVLTNGLKILGILVPDKM